MCKNKMDFNIFYKNVNKIKNLSLQMKIFVL